MATARVALLGGTTQGLADLAETPVRYAGDRGHPTHAFDFARAPDPWFLAELDRIAARAAGGELSWLFPMWIPFDEVAERDERGKLTGKTRLDPVERWVLFQMTPQRATPATVWAADQRILYDRRLKRFIPDPRFPLRLARENMNRWQWELFRLTGQYGQAYWVVQGDSGGHRKRFDRVEERVCMVHGAPTEPPAARALPYAPLDERVIQKLEPIDRVRFWKRGISFAERSPDELDQEMTEAVQAFRAQLWAWLESQTEKRVDEGRRYWREAIDGGQRVHVDAATARRRMIDLDRTKHEFITAD